MLLCLKRETPFRLLRFNEKERPCAQTYHFTSDEWAHGILLVAGSKVEMVFPGGNKQKLCFFQLLKRSRDFNLSPFRKIEPDQVKKFVCNLWRDKKLLLNWGSNPCHKSLWCHEGLLKKKLSTTNRKRKIELSGPSC